MTDTPQNRDELVELLAKQGHNGALAYHDDSEELHSWEGFSERWRDKARFIAEAQLSAIEQSGLVIVPKEPTHEMARQAYFNGAGGISEIVKAALSASPFRTAGEADAQHWHPIETVPEDIGLFDVWGPDRGYLSEVYIDAFGRITKEVPEDGYTIRHTFDDWDGFTHWTHPLQKGR